MSRPLERTRDATSSTGTGDGDHLHREGQTPQLLLRACAGHGDGIRDTVTQLLLEAKQEDVNCRDAFHQTALILVCLNSGDVGLCETLIQAGCDVNARDAFGRTALHICCDRSLNELAYLLLDSGADPHARTKEKGGDSPLLWAMRANNQDLCVKLLEKERDLNSSNIDELRASKERFTSTNGREECPLSISCKESIQSIVHDAYRAVCARLEQLEEDEKREQEKRASVRSSSRSTSSFGSGQAFSNYLSSSQTTSLSAAQAEQQDGGPKPPKKLKIKMKKRT